MWFFPGQETMPYHVAWIGLALAYDREVWGLRPTIVAVILFTSITGGVLIIRASEGVVGWQETAEIPLMSLLLALVMWNVWRRRQALAALAQLAERDRRRAAGRERLSRLTSHEMRTPATIAQGYTELLLQRDLDADVHADLDIVSSELSRLVRASDRLVRMIRLPDVGDGDDVELQTLAGETVQRWGAIAERDWQVDSAGVGVRGVQANCSADRIRACLDTLIENALRYTGEGDTIRVIVREVGATALVGVADSGPGLDRCRARELNEPVAGDDESDSSPDARSQTGLGLLLVREVADARGGRLTVGRSAEGGALMLMALPKPGAHHATTPDESSMTAG